MAAGPGARLDAYELIRPLGAGGMGEVWLAHDVGLGRKVALKLLPQALTDDPHRVARFEQEARAASGLSHPNICHVYALGRTAEGQRYIAMELVDGRTLRSRLNAGPLPLLEALRIATQIAGAVSAAHAAGIIHRDLKPENVMVRTDGLVKILDFGLAKLSQASDAAAGNDSTQTVFKTDAGSIVGTVAYMSPEQARGQPLDVRTDVWSLGVMLYELAAGRRPFTGQSSSDVLASILDRDPDLLSRFDPATPPELQRIVTKSLRKERSQRYQSMSDLALDLETLRDDLHLKSKTSTDSPPVAAEAANYWSRRRLTQIGVSAAILALAVAAWSMLGNTTRRGATESNSPVQRRLTRLTFDELAWCPTFSPDGRYVAYVSTRSGYSNVWVLATAGGRPLQVTKSSSDESWPDYSPDGNAIAFARGAEGIFVVPPLGGQERRVAAIDGTPSWSPDGSQILVSSNSASSNIRLFLARADRSPERVLERFLEGGFWLSPTWHPDGRITISGRHKTAGRGIFTVSHRDGAWVKTEIPRELIEQSGIDPERPWVFSWAPSARFLYATLMTSGAANVWRLQMDATLRVTALDRLTTGPGTDWAPRVSRDGKSLLFSTITGDSRLWSFPLDPVAGKAPVTGQPLSEEDGEVNWASVSADGRRLAYFYQPLNSTLKQSELRLFSVPFSQPSETVSADRYVRMASAWSRSGDRLALQAAELSSSGTPLNNVVLIRGRDGSEQVIARCQATEGQACTIAPMDWTPDDTAILTASRLGGERTTKLTVWPVSVTSPSDTPRATLVSDSRWSVTSAAYSPEGRWVAFAYGTAFRDEKGIAVAPASGQVEGASWQSIAQGFEEIGNPKWSADGRFLYFTSSHSDRLLNVWRVQIASSTGSQVGQPSRVTAFSSLRFFLLSRTYYPTIAVGPDRLVLPMNSQQSAVWMLDNVDR